MVRDFSRQCLSLSSHRPDVTDQRVTRLLAMLLIVLLALSHGAMGEAVPHSDSSDHVVLTHDEHHGAPEAPDKSDSVPQAMHVHCAADVAPDRFDEPPVPACDGDTPAVRLEVTLASREEAPPIRPPSA